MDDVSQVYIVVAHRYDDTWIEGVFADEESAAAYIASEDVTGFSTTLTTETWAVGHPDQ